MRFIIFIFTLILSWQYGFSQVCINEILSLNSSGIRDVDQDFSDWIEIYNRGESPLDLEGFGLSDERSVPVKWLFPQRIIPAHGFLLVFANGKDYELYTNFRLDADSERVYLFSPSGTLIDSAGGEKMTRDISLGRFPDGGSQWRFFGFSTPEFPNSGYGSGSEHSPSVFINPEGGKFDNPFPLTITTQYLDDSIYFTTDGSVPGPGSELYTGPFEVTSNTVIRARTIRFNALPGPVATRTYVTGRDHDIPVVCLSTNSDNLWDDEYGIYTFGLQPHGEYPYYEANYWKDWERPVHMELYDENRIRRVDQELGLKIYGAWSRAYDQKSFGLYAKKIYGKGSMEYQFFDDKPVTRFKAVILRNSGDDNNGLQFQDCFLTGLTRNMDIDRQAYQPAAVYINGEYWGLLNLREKISSDFIASNHQVEADSVNLLEGPGTIVAGTDMGYAALVSYLENQTTLQNDAEYEMVREKINIDNFLKYEISEIYVNNRDWPGNNIKYWNTTTQGSRWRWILFDTDAGFGIWNTEDYRFNTLDFALENDGPESPNPPWSTLLLRRILTNPGCRNSFIIQFCDRLNLDFHPDRINADLDSFKALYDHEMAYHFERWWGDMDAWQERIINRRTFGENRPAYCRQFLAKEFDLGAELNVTVDVSGQGSIKLNTINPGTYPFTGIYFEDLPIQLTAIPKAGYRFVRWEGSISSPEPTITYDMADEGTFTAIFAEAVQEPVSVIINEINYASPDNYDTKDWIELYNNGTITVDLGGWIILDSGVDSAFTFNKGTVLIPGGYIVVCRSLNDFRKYNPEVTNSVGNMGFGLSGQGDIVRLFNPRGQLADAVNFGISAPWPANANGTGKSIELRAPLLDNSQGANWQAITMGGTPGSPNARNQVSTNIPGIAGSGLSCFPAPFNERTTISFTVGTPGKYRLEIVDLQGRTIKVLADQLLDGGSYWIDWIAGDIQSGVYLIRLAGDNVVETSKVIKM